MNSSANPIESASGYSPLPEVTDKAPNKEYALIGKIPAKVGGQSVEKQRRYISSLAGPNGEELIFRRTGSCCPYPSINGTLGTALVDIFEVTYNGLIEPVFLYISFYDKETLYIPEGFTRRNIN